MKGSDKVSDSRKLEIFDNLVALINELCTSNNISYNSEIEICKKYLNVTSEELIYMGIRDLNFEEEISTD